MGAAAGSVPGWGGVVVTAPINFVRLIVLSSFSTFNPRQSLGICSHEYDEKKAVVKVRRHIFVHPGGADPLSGSRT